MLALLEREDADGLVLEDELDLALHEVDEAALVDVVVLVDLLGVKSFAWAEPDLLDFIDDPEREVLGEAVLDDGDVLEDDSLILEDELFLEVSAEFLDDGHFLLLSVIEAGVMHTLEVVLDSHLEFGVDLLLPHVVLNDLQLLFVLSLAVLEPH